MEENLPKVYKKSFVANLFHKIKALFFHKEKEKEVDLLAMKMTEEEKFEINEEIRKEHNKAFEVELKKLFVYESDEQKHLISHVEIHPELIESHSVDELEQVLEYYNKQNVKKREFLKKFGL